MRTKPNMLWLFVALKKECSVDKVAQTLLNMGMTVTSVFPHDKILYGTASTDSVELIRLLAEVQEVNPEGTTYVAKRS